MGDSLQVLLSELERFGESNDSRVEDRAQRMLNITPDTGAFLSAMILATNSQRVLEIGTSNGYSTIWLAHAVRRTRGSVTTVDISEYKTQLARDNFRRSGLESLITMVHEDAKKILARSDEESYDLIFLDSERLEYPQWWSNLKRILRAGGTLIVDNATSHPDELEPFFDVIRQDAQFASCLLPLGKGEFFAVKAY